MHEGILRLLFCLSLVYLCMLCILLLYTMSSHLETHSKDLPKSIKRRNQNPLLSKNKNCMARFGKTPDEDQQRALNINISVEAEHIIQRLGFPPSKTHNGKHAIPVLEDMDMSEIPVIITATSTNHYRETQALAHNLHYTIQRTYPHLKFIIYDIGLGPEELIITKLRCRCEVRRFRFENYPRHLRNMDTRAWKPVIIQEALNEFGFVMYLDASIRFRRINFDDIFLLARKSGHLFLQSNPHMANFIPNHTHIDTFKYFHEQPCLFHDRKEVQSGFVIIMRNNVYSNILMKSWLACCLQEQCVLPDGANIGMCNRTSLMYHKCHRPDQSPLGIIVNLLYHPPYSIPFIPYDVYDIRRNHQLDFF